MYRIFPVELKKALILLIIISVLGLVFLPLYRDLYFVVIWQSGRGGKIFLNFPQKAAIDIMQYLTDILWDKCVLELEIMQKGQV